MKKINEFFYKNSKLFGYALYLYVIFCFIRIWFFSSIQVLYIVDGIFILIIGLWFLAIYKGRSELEKQKHIEQTPEQKASYNRQLWGTIVFAIIAIIWILFPATMNNLLKSVVGEKGFNSLVIFLNKI